MLTGRQQTLYEEAYGAYVRLRDFCGEYGDRVVRTGTLEKLSHNAILELQLQKILFGLSLQYEETLTDHEIQFFQGLSEDTEELSGQVSGYRRFYRKLDAASFSGLDQGVLELTGELPWCLQIALKMDRRKSDEYTSYFLKDYMTILDAFVCLDGTARQEKTDAVSLIFDGLVQRTKEGNPLCGEVNNQEILDRMWYIKEVRPKEKEQEKTLGDLIRELNEMVGLQGVKDNVNQMLRVLQVRQEMQRRGFPEMSMSMHMVFTGNPGTGKTTVARLLAQIYRKMGILSKGQLIEADRSMLVAGYVGQTEQKTKEVISSAMGGILFIDEAYTLADGQGQNDYGQEVISTLLKAMEDCRDSLVVIVAGYPEKMKKFLASNPGLQSRFNTTIHFEDYTPEEMLSIFNYTCRKNGYSPTPGCRSAAREEIRRHCMMKDEHFANGRDVRNYFEKVVRQQNMRIAGEFENLKDVDDDMLTQLTGEDAAGVTM